MLNIERRQLLEQEKGTRFKHASFSLALLYPSPYAIGMSSLGFQSLYRIINDESENWSASRAFLPEALSRFVQSRRPIEALETGRPVANHDVIGVSIAYELEIFGLIHALSLSGLKPLARERSERDPPVIIGGPLTFSNPLPCAPFADAILMGECEQLLPDVLALFATHTKQAALEAIAQLPHVLVPSIHGEMLPKVAACHDTLLPAYSAIMTPNTELSNMFLIEAERGCHRNCTFCVMRRSTNGGMRLVSEEKLLSLIPQEAKKVGLVGAAVSDHPKIVSILRALVEGRGLKVGISSLRADRLNDEFVRLLALGGYRTLTVASDAPSQRLRDSMEKKIKEKHLLRSAELAKAHRLKLLKTYMMIGTPDETDEDIDELIRFARELSAVHPLAIGIAPFVPKYNTPLADQEFIGAKIVSDRLKRLKAGLQGKAEVRVSSVKEALVEAILATSGFEGGEIAYQAMQAFPLGNFKEFLKYIEERDAMPKRRPQNFVEPHEHRRRAFVLNVVSG